MAFPVINPILQFFDNSGQVLSGGLLYTYSPGTTTPKTTYTDENLSVPNSNPIVLDSAGRCTIFLTDAEEYKFVLQTSAGVTLRTVDEVKSPASITQAVVGAALYPRTAEEIAAGITPTNYYYQTGHVYRYGTNSTPGTTDMSTPLQRAIDSIPAGGTVYLPAALLSIGSTNITITKSLTIQGEGGRENFDNSWDNGGGSRIHYKGLTGDAISISPPNSTNSRIKVILRNFVLRGARVSPGSATSGRGIVIDGRQLGGTAIHLHRENVYVAEAKDEGWYITGAVYGGSALNWGAYDCGKNGIRDLTAGSDPIGEEVWVQTRIFDNGADGTGDEKAGLRRNPGATSNVMHGLSCSNNSGPGAILQGGNFQGSGWQFESNAGTSQLYLGSAGGGAGLTSLAVTGIAFSPGSSYTGDLINITSDASNVKIIGVYFGDTLGGGGNDVRCAGSSCSIAGITGTHTFTHTTTATDAFYEGVTPHSFTPSLRFGGATTGITYTTQVGRYLKVGNAIDFTIYIVLSAKGSATGAAVIEGLPIASANITNLIHSVSVTGDTLVNTVDVLAGRVLPNSTGILLYRYFDGSLTALADTDFNNTSSLSISGRIFV